MGGSRTRGVSREAAVCLEKLAFDGFPDKYTSMHCQSIVMKPSLISSHLSYFRVVSTNPCRYAKVSNPSSEADYVELGTPPDNYQVNESDRKKFEVEEELHVHSQCNRTPAEVSLLYD